MSDITIRPGLLDAAEYREIFEFLSQSGAVLETIGSSYNGVRSTLTLTFSFDGSFAHTTESLCLK